MTSDRDEFPCWLAGDAKGALAYDWHEVVLVETADNGSASIFLTDGSEWIFRAVEPVLDGAQFFRKLAKVLPLREVIGQTKPPC
jgi:hypothetical protein